MPDSRIQLPATDEAVLTSDAQAAEDDDLTSEMLVEEVSIDGMCGVY